MASILSIRMQKCSHLTGAVNVLRPFSNVMNMRDVCLQHHSPLDKVKQSATKADFTIHGRKDEKEPSVRKTHCSGRKHKENVRLYYQKWLEEQVQKLVDDTTAAFKAGGPSVPTPGPGPVAAPPMPAGPMGGPGHMPQPMPLMGRGPGPRPMMMPGVRPQMAPLMGPPMGPHMGMPFGGPPLMRKP